MSQNLFSIHPVAGRIGAEIRGIQLGPNLDPQIREQIYQALLTHKVIFFRDQKLDNQEQEAFGKLFGDLVAHPTVPTVEGTESVLELDSKNGGRANSWHTDVTFVPAYPKLSILRAITIPEAGGDTVWANTHTAYNDLPQDFKDLADKLWAVHSNEYDYAASRPDLSSEQAEKYKAIFASTIYQTEHPVVHVHPETGEKNLLLGHFLKKIIGLSVSDSQRIFDYLQNQVTRLENTVRWRWKEGDVAIWDNRATQHYAINDYNDAHRVVRRVTVDGDIAKSVDGRESKLLQVQEKAKTQAA